MSDEISLGGRTYVSSKRAAKACGYAQDYVGQLARGGVIDAQRVGGLWYVSMESLEAYKRNAEAFTPVQPEGNVAKEIDTIVSFDGKDYVSAARAAKLTGYNADYVGQLARAGKVLSRQVGNRWYVERDGLLSHKTQKDALLAAVQAESVGLQRPPSLAVAPKASVRPAEPYLTYIHEEDHLMPVLTKPEPVLEEPEKPSEVQQIPIRIVPHARTVQPLRKVHTPAPQPVRISGISMNKAAKAVVALTVVIVVSYGFVSIKSESIYAFFRPSENTATSSDSMTAAAAEAFEMLGDMLENIVAPEISFKRGM